MEVDLESLRAELRVSVQRTVELQQAMDVAEGRVPQSGIPHDTVIEEAAHRAGCEASRLLQERHIGEVVARQSPRAKCPACGTRCDLKPQKRKVVSGDGEIELQELVGQCPDCRRAFFPFAGGTGV